jgi:hypothetical protein
MKQTMLSYPVDMGLQHLNVVGSLELRWKHIRCLLLVE